MSAIAHNRWFVLGLIVLANCGFTLAAGDTGSASTFQGKESDIFDVNLVPLSPDSSVNQNAKDPPPKGDDDDPLAGLDIQADLIPAYDYADGEKSKFGDKPPSRGGERRQPPPPPPPPADDYDPPPPKQPPPQYDQLPDEGGYDQPQPPRRQPHREEQRPPPPEEVPLDGPDPNYVEKAAPAPPPPPPPPQQPLFLPPPPEPEPDPTLYQPNMETLTNIQSILPPDLPLERPPQTIEQLPPIEQPPVRQPPVPQPPVPQPPVPQPPVPQPPTLAQQVQSAAYPDRSQPRLFHQHHEYSNEQSIQHDKNRDGESWNFSPSRYHESSFFVPAEPEEFEEMTGKKVRRPGDPPEPEPTKTTANPPPPPSPPPPPPPTSSPVEIDMFEINEQPAVILPSSPPVIIDMRKVPKEPVVQPDVIASDDTMDRGSIVLQPKKTVVKRKKVGKTRKVYKIAKRDKNGKIIPGQFQLVRPITRRTVKTGRRVVIKPTSKPALHQHG